MFGPVTQAQIQAAGQDTVGRAAAVAVGPTDTYGIIGLIENESRRIKSVFDLAPADGNAPVGPPGIPGATYNAVERLAATCLLCMAAIRNGQVRT